MARQGPPGVLAVLLLSGAAWAAETMRIAVGVDVPRAVVQGRQLSLGEDREEAPFLTLNRAEAAVTMDAAQLSMDGRPLVQEALRFRAGDDALTVNGTRVRGDVVVLRGKSGVVVVNVLPLEEYLVGVLGSEMPKSFPLEALKAQAVAARTYALHKKLEQYGQPYHLGSSVISQVYRGLDADDPRTREAVESTRGLVLTYELQPIEAYFHASCGGKTEGGAEALGRALPYLRAVKCPCGDLPSSRWSLTLGAAELKALGGPRASSLEVESRTSTGRARRVTVGARSLEGVSLRARVGYTRLKSLNFEVERLKGGVRLEGRGFGHGAGLCQWGARVLAEQGLPFRQILAHYYPDTELQVLY